MKIQGELNRYQAANAREKPNVLMMTSSSQPNEGLHNINSSELSLYDEPGITSIMSHKKILKS